MPLNRNDQNTIRQCLLGQLSEGKQQDIEQRLVTEDDLFGELEVTEDELFDQYIAHELTQVERERFERYFLATPEREHELRFAEALDRYVSKKTARQDAKESSPSTAELSWLERTRLRWTSHNGLFRIATVAAAAIVIASALWIVMRYRYSPQSYATVTLTISYNSRAQGDAATKLTLPIQADVLKLYLKLSETAAETPRYRVELLRENDRPRTLQIVEQDAKSVAVVIPASELSRGQYALKVYAVKSDGAEERLSGNYFLTVE